MNSKLKWFPRLGVYKNSTGSIKYNPATGKGYSYNWYLMADRIGVKEVLNTYGYSVTTTGHVRALDNLRRFSVFIEAPNGLQDLDASVALYTSRIAKLKGEIANPRSRPEKNVKREALINHYLDKLWEVKELQEMKRVAA